MTSSSTTSSATDFWKQQFGASATSPVAWRWSAERLKRAADVLIPQIEADLRFKRDLAMNARVGELLDSQDFASIIGVYMMLSGLAMENLAKASYVAKDCLLHASGEKLKSVSHNTQWYLDQSWRQLTNDEKELLQRLQRFAETQGRYPIPRTVEDSLPRNNPNGTLQIDVNWPSDIHRINCLYEELYEYCRSLPPFGTGSPMM